MNVGRLYASRQQYGDSWHAAECRLFMQQKHRRSKQWCKDFLSVAWCGLDACSSFWRAGKSQPNGLTTQACLLWRSRSGVFRQQPWQRSDQHHQRFNRTCAMNCSGHLICSGAQRTRWLLRRPLFSPRDTCCWVFPMGSRTLSAPSSTTITAARGRAGPQGRGRCHGQPTGCQGRQTDSSAQLSL